MVDKKNEKDEKLRKFILMLEISKTPDRVKFESEYDLYLYIIRDKNSYGYDIDSLYDHHDDYKLNPEKFVQNISNMKLRARFNMGELRGVWLPIEFGRLSVGDLSQPHIKELLDKYSFKL